MVVLPGTKRLIIIIAITFTLYINPFHASSSKLLLFEGFSATLV